MATFILSHRHEAHECAPSFAAWHGFDSPLRHGHVLAGCLTGSHRMFWFVEAPDCPAALALLPAFVAERTVATRVREVPVP
jgi:hypothetical protein